MRIDRYQIATERNLYFPGQVVKGVLVIASPEPIKCRGIRVHLQGKAQSHFIIKRGKKSKAKTETQFYTNCKRTVFGNLSSTPVMNNAGTNAIFGPPWAPDEGVLYMHLPAQSEEVILRVMDYEWLKKDIVLGEALVNVFNVAGKGPFDVPLMRNGKAEKGTLSFSVDWDPSSDNRDPHGQAMRGLKVTILKATDLRSSGWVSANDVYVQAYPRISPIVANSGLPEPPTEIVLPVGEFRVPFEFQLPADLPSTFIWDHSNYIAYSLYSNIDIAWKRDPSTRTFFTVLQPLPSSLLMTPLTRSAQHSLNAQCCFPPCCCCSFNCTCAPMGRLTATLSTDRSGYAPGEMINATLDYSSEWSNFESSIEKLTLEIEQTVRIFAVDETIWRKRTMVLQVLNKGVKNVKFQVPPLPPSYNGGIGKDQTWFGQVARYGTRWGTPKPDPLVWSYSLVAKFVVKLPGLWPWSKTFTVSLPFSISGLGLNILPALSVHPVVPAASIAPVLSADKIERVSPTPSEEMFQVPSWRADTRISPAVYAQALTACQPTRSLDAAVVIRDEQEDLNTVDVHLLACSPQYLVSPSAPPAPGSA